MKHFEEKAYLCALNRIFGFRPKIALALISHFGSASEIFELEKRELDRILGPYSGYYSNLNLSSVEKEAKELDKLQTQNIFFTGWTEKEYPSLLKECEDAPLGLYIRSRTPIDRIFDKRKEIAVVGTRDISLYGKEICEKTISSLSKTSERPRIISGLALGVDICAHKAAIENGLETIAVMATGPDDIYPFRHREFALRLCDTPGCALVTDYPPGTAPLAIHFLRRNRIIAGLSEALLLIESKIKGGGMMTSRLAFSYNRDVYALPGRVDDTRSQGCNSLIKNKIAEPIISIEELIRSLELSSVRKYETENLEHTLDRMYSGKIKEDRLALMSTILLAIRSERGITIEEICFKYHIDYSMTATLARRLEADGFISIDLMQRCTIVSRK